MVGLVKNQHHLGLGIIPSLDSNGIKILRSLLVTSFLPQTIEKIILIYLKRTTAVLDKQLQLLCERSRAGPSSLNRADQVNFHQKCRVTEKQSECGGGREQCSETQTKMTNDESWTTILLVSAWQAGTKIEVLSENSFNTTDLQPLSAMQCSGGHSEMK